MLILPILGALAGVGSIVSGILSYKAAEEDRKHREKMAREQMEYERKMIEEARQYDSPIEQKKRLEAAGLNPYLQNISAGSYVSVPSFASYDLGPSPAVSAMESGLSILTNFLKLGKDFFTLQQQQDLVNLQKLELSERILHLQQQNLGYPLQKSVEEAKLNSIKLQNEFLKDELKASRAFGNKTFLNTGLQLLKMIFGGGKR